MAHSSNHTTHTQTQRHMRAHMNMYMCVSRVVIQWEASLIWEDEKLHCES